MSGRPSQGASAVLKGAPLATLRFLHAHSCLVASSCIEGGGNCPATTEPHGLRRPKTTNALIARSRSKRQRHDPPTAKAAPATFHFSSCGVLLLAVHEREERADHGIGALGLTPWPRIQCRGTTAIGSGRPNLACSVRSAGQWGSTRAR